jgi:hypothetical protein
MRIDEFQFQDLLGRASEFGGRAPNTAGVGSAKARAKKSGLSPEDQLTQDIFVKKFVSRGANAINVAVQQGLVDLNQGSATTAPNAAAAVKAGKAPGNQAIATGQKQGVAKPAIDQQVDKLVSAMRKLQPAGTKPLPAVMQKDPTTGKDVRVPTSKLEKEIVADMGKVALNKDYLIRVADRIQKANAQGYDVKDVHTQFMGQLAKGMKNKSIQEARMFEILVRLVNESQFRKQVQESGHDPLVVMTRIRTLLESSTNEGIMDKIKGMFKGKQPAAAPAQPAAAPAAPSGKPGLGQWFKDTFMKTFLSGIDTSSADNEIKAILDKMPQSYKAGTIGKDLTDLAMIAYTLSDQGKSQEKEPKTA